MVDTGYYATDLSTRNQSVIRILSEMAEARRRLAAILSADVVGYSRLMGNDEQATVNTLNAYRQVFRERITEHEGRVVDTAGDSVLATFDSVVEAIQCALEIQQTLEVLNDPLAESRRMRFRIGVNLGDIIEQDDGTVYGDGVNIAARLESLAPAGGVTLSGQVHDFIEGKIKEPVTFIGEHEVKNIARPVRVYQLGRALETAADPTSRDNTPARSNLPDKPSIAVLPFTNMSDNADEAYFADGISEDIITELSRFQELVVVARNSTFVYKDKAVKAQDVGADLNVRYILEGSVRKAGGRVRVTAQLVEAASGHHLWAERYDRSIEDVFAVQDELTSKIVATLHGRLLDSERRRIRSDDRTENLQAYELVLRGRELWFRFTEEDNCAARRLYKEAIALDPEYGRAYASLAWSYVTAYNEYWTDDPQGSLDKALKIALDGVRVNPASHSNRLALGQVYFYKKMLNRALENFEKGIELNPNDPDGYVFLATALSHNGAPEEALERLEHAFALNPNLAQWHRSIYIVAYFNARRYDDAIAVWNKLDEPPVYFLRWIAATFAHLGRSDEALENARKYMARYPNFNLDEHLSRMPFRHTEDLDHYAAGLTRAGLGHKEICVAG
ncbi:MAG: adenylate/guanylate cyclase domain-containing protein [Proteobacteria bacterium]|nr:MAG: adenylate/guanylate cyclase domain-containing protein [Pseudomonadota bacterium]